MRVFSFFRSACLFVLLVEPAGVLAQAAEPPYSILHTFQPAESYPQAPLVSDGRGNLYGTTAQGGSANGGTVFTIRTDGSGFQRLHAFVGGAGDGLDPEASLILDGSGNLYGTTLTGGPWDEGVVFTMKTDGSGFRVLHAFAGGTGDGTRPYAPLTLDGMGNLFGTTTGNGASYGGTVFTLKTDGTGYRLLHSFVGGAGDGRFPFGALLLDSSGNLFGATAAGGEPGASRTRYGDYEDGQGTIFSMRIDGSGPSAPEDLPLRSRCRGFSLRLSHGRRVGKPVRNVRLRRLVGPRVCLQGQGRRIEFPGSALIRRRRDRRSETR